MSFAYALPWWAALCLAIAGVGVAWLTYRRPLVPLAPPRRIALVALRAAVLIAIALLLFRPSGLRIPDVPRDAVVPVLVDVSRSMGIADAADGRTRLAEAVDVATTRIQPALAPRFDVELFTFSRALEPGLAPDARPDGASSDLGAALDAVRERYRGRPVAAAVVISDGGDTDPGGVSEGEGGPPIFTIGVGSADPGRDREVTAVAVGEQRLDQASVDLRATVVSRGYGRDAFTVRLLANGDVVDSHRVTPAADGSPIEDVFTVAPDAAAPSVYTVEIPPEAGERAAENNRRSVMVAPPGRTRRLLAIEGAPGFEHSFLARAWAHDASLAVDTIVRKGRNEEGQNTFLVTAAADRSAALLTGFPATREALYGYDAVVLSNIEGDFFTRAQLLMLADFVSVRGGGLLVSGGESFSAGGYAGTPLEPVLPVRLTDRQGALAVPGLAAKGRPGQLTLTADGERHPIMRLGAGAADTRERWAGMPPLASVAPLGAPRPGAQVLAVAPAEGGGALPVIAVQPYGQGRAMVFAGAASWRWRMLLPSGDERFERFWRQTARWLASASPDPVSIEAPASADPGRSMTIAALARTRAFEPVADAAWTATLTGPDGESRPLDLRRVDASTGRFEAAVRPDAPGLYHVQLEARQGDLPLGSADRWFLAGGVDREFVDPRLDDALLERLARSTGGRYVPAADAGTIAESLSTMAPPPAAPERYDLWQQPWVWALIVLMLAGEWILRRRWGLR